MNIKLTVLGLIVLGLTGCAGGGLVNDGALLTYPVPNAKPPPAGADLVDCQIRDFNVNLQTGTFVSAAGRTDSETIINVEKCILWSMMQAMISGRPTEAELVLMGKMLDTLRVMAQNSKLVTPLSLEERMSANDGLTK